MANENDKGNYAKEMMNIATELSDLAARIEVMNSVWAQKSYGSGGADVIVDGDLPTSLPINATKLQSLNYAFENFIKFLDNDSPEVAAHRSSIVDAKNVDGTYAITLP